MLLTAENYLSGVDEYSPVMLVLGTWIKTFASTGPWIPLGIAASPVTSDVFVATNTGPTNNIILRYHSGGSPLGPSGSYWSTFDLFPYFSQNPVQLCSLMAVATFT